MRPLEERYLFVVWQSDQIDDGIDGSKSFRVGSFDSQII